MKTWEMIKELTENPGKKFKRVCDELEISVDIYGGLIWESGYSPLNICEEWEEVKKPVSFIEAVASGRKIKVVHDDNKLLGYRILDTLLRDLVRNHPMSHVREILLNGEFYTED